VASFPEQVFLRKGSSSLWITQELDGDPKLDLLSDPDLLFSYPQCEVIKDQRKIKVGRVELEIGGRTRGVYLKRYNVFSWRYRLGSLFLPSAASRSWVGAGILKRAGFCTGQPIAAFEYRSWGMLTKSFYLSEEIPRAKTVDFYWREELVPIRSHDGFRRKREFLRRLAMLFKSLHERNIYHNDLKDANILVCRGNDNKQESFYLLDLEGIRIYRYLNRRRQIKNLVQLNRTMGKFLRRTEKLYWLKTYLSTVFFDRGEKRKWIRRVLEKSDRGDRRSLRKR
jgi:serine/threonine protein kinase